MSEANGKEFYTTQQQEHVKQHIQLDGQGRPFKTFTAAKNHPVGAPCEVTVYGYLDPSSAVIINRVETSGTWIQSFQDAIDLLLV